MHGHGTPSRYCAWAQNAFPLALTLVGCLLLRAGLHVPAVASTRLTVRPVAAGVSSRGQRAARELWLALDRPMLQPAPAVPWLQRPALPAFGPGARARLALKAAPKTVAKAAPEPPRTEVVTYTVQKGDTVFLISKKFNVSQETIIWANDKLDMDPDLLSIGQDLWILPVTGVWHTVKAGDTLASIAKRYQVTPEVITGYAPNGVSDTAALIPGRKLIVPGGIRPFEPRLVYTAGGAVTVNALPQAGLFIWPCNGAITQYFSQYHLAIDIGNREGTPIYAAAAGTVTLAGWYGTMGNTVRISHAGGYETLYGHMSKVLVQVGQVVKQGEQIGLMGSTGKSTGPHTHFIIHRGGGAVNPIRYLPH